MHAARAKDRFAGNRGETTRLHSLWEGDLGLVQIRAMAGGKLWVAGVELAVPASPRRKPRTGGVDLRSPTPATRRCYPHLNHAAISSSFWQPTQDGLPVKSAPKTRPR